MSDYDNEGKNVIPAYVGDGGDAYGGGGDDDGNGGNGYGGDDDDDDGGGGEKTAPLSS